MKGLGVVVVFCKGVVGYGCGFFIFDFLFKFFFCIVSFVIFFNKDVFESLYVFIIFILYEGYFCVCLRDELVKMEWDFIFYF